jgi:hypothetical protein
MEAGTTMTALRVLLKPTDIDDLTAFGRGRHPSVKNTSTERIADWVSQSADI